MDFVRRWSEKAEIGVGRFIPWLGVTASKFYDWRERYGCVNEHNGWVPRDFWLEPWEKEGIIGFHLQNQPHHHWHIDVSYIDLCGTFYCLLQHSGRVQPFPRALGLARVDAGSGCRTNSR